MIVSFGSTFAREHRKLSDSDTGIGVFLKVTLNSKTQSSRQKVLNGRLFNMTSANFAASNTFSKLSDPSFRFDFSARLVNFLAVSFLNATNAVQLSTEPHSFHTA